ncbi:hypothetical protein SAMN05192559_10336 [Halobacillus karajensis]|uniref:Uncharacterized protein n=1 Tax=Halobacillus karajensis TaxID=195088 RepID=A0A024P372_9BACI|nr:hypothetical protein [Halobacillus karajensis]CDQ20018.1 hypothetical protein BN982_02326 [Halobacillus karajensis]CDQ22478.1 hypothetical protein BN983_00687 [Halobacillus karajensis]CDQ28321.1 hypothetical protein BN981_02616 [Halobacillus karajensis]SEH68017.1 hypothetical protein SAMN05192559_10336 [Halobacillus karajensis]
MNKLRIMSFAVFLLSILLLVSLLGYTIIPKGVTIISIFVLAVLLSIYGTKHKKEKT